MESVIVLKGVSVRTLRGKRSAFRNLFGCEPKIMATGVFEEIGTGELVFVQSAALEVLSLGYVTLRLRSDEPAQDTYLVKPTPKGECVYRFLRP